MMDAQPMKRGLTDFFSSYRKRFVVALIAVNLSGCAVVGGEGGQSGFVGPHIIIPYLAAAVVVTPIVIPIMAGQTVVEKTERKKQEAVKALAPQVRDYLKTACEKDERLFIKSGIDLNEGILVLNNRGNALLPLLELAPKEVYFKEIQYGYAIPWDDDNSLEKTWWWAVDKEPPSEALEQKFFIETGKGKYIQRARKAFWEQAGLRERVLKDSLQAKAWRDKGWSKAKILEEYEVYTSGLTRFDLPVDAPSARYALSIEDISTLEDRAHWVARGRITLMERNTGETVAEYVGFQANLKPWEQFKTPSRHWHYFSSSYQLCPSADSYSVMLPIFLRTVEKGARETVPNFKELLTEKKR
ncbi:MAG: hypothetical protein LBQ75_09890 [Zoogloeaceae bacterium]|jgi:hypothetical protein|nr:hypothetical protein [Zoogloeaceae bacterium]